MTAVAWSRARPLGSLFATGIAVVVLARYGFTPAGVVAAFASVVLVVLSQTDLESHRLPNRIVLPAAAVILAARLVTAPAHWAAWLGAALGVAGFLLVFALAWPAGLGMGDVKLGLLLGAALGAAVMPALLLGTLAGAAAAIVVLVRDGLGARGRALPYGPFLAFGAIATFLLLAP
jgi:leader peptidase (prepilin peptidase) / N-methyltransferase